MMVRVRRYKDMTGQRYGRITVLRWHGLRNEKHSEWLCKCDCGKEWPVLRQSLVSGNSQSCGCLNREKITKHGRFGTPEYMVWSAMIQRCGNPNAKKYPSYGAVGIKVCERWAESFENFYSDMGPRPDGASLDRVDGSSGYSPDNCRWTDIITQNRNRKSVVPLEFQGRSLTIVEWAEETGLPVNTIRTRLRSGWPTERILTQTHQRKTRRAA